MTAQISSAKWTALRTIEVRGQNFKENPSETDVKIKDDDATEDAVAVLDVASVLTVTSQQVKKGDTGAKIKVVGADGNFSSYKSIEE